MFFEGTNGAPKRIVPHQSSIETTLSKVTWDFQIPRPKGHFLILYQSCFHEGTKTSLVIFSREEFKAEKWVL